MSGYTEHVVYASTTGEIMRAGSCATVDMSLQPGAGESVMEGTANDTTEYVLNGVITPKPASSVTVDTTTIAADGVEAATLSNISNPSTVSFTGPEAIADMEITDGTLVFDTDEPGTYVLTIQSFPELEKEIIIVAS